MRRIRRGSVGHKRLLRGVPARPAGLPSVTVVVPAHNYARFLDDCAESVLTQRDVETRLLIADDASTDETPDVAARLSEADTRVTVIRHDRNRGLVPTVNELFRRVQTEYVVKLDADDLLPPGSLARATALLEAHPDVAFVYGRPCHFSGAVPEIRDDPPRSWTIWSGGDWLAARCRCGVGVISQPEVVIRTSYLRRVLPLRAELKHTSDLHLWLELACRGDVARVNGPVQGLYRVHDASMQRTVHAGVMVDLEGRRAAFDALLAPRARQSVHARHLRMTAQQSLAAAALDEACRAYDRGRTEERPVDELVAFALETFADARSLKEWRALERRRAVGAGQTRQRARFFLAAVGRRTSEEVSRSLWLRTGEW